jgi:hypothetical protein
LATKIKAQIKNRLSFLIEKICKKKLLTEPQLNGNHLFYSNENLSSILFFVFFVAAFDYFLSNLSEAIDENAFNQYCGVDVVVTPEQIKSAVRFLSSFGLFKFFKDAKDFKYFSGY